MSDPKSVTKSLSGAVIGEAGLNYRPARLTDGQQNRRIIIRSSSSLYPRRTGPFIKPMNTRQGKTQAGSRELNL